MASRSWRVPVSVSALLILALGSAGAANLVQDPGFELSPAVGTFNSVWNLSSTNWNCTIELGQGSSCFGDPSQTASLYVHSGNWGTFLGDDTPGESSMYQTFALGPGSYAFSFYWRYHYTYAGGANSGELDAYIGAAPGGTPGWAAGDETVISASPTTTIDWAQVVIPYAVSTSGTYYIGFEWYDVPGEFAIDDVSLDAPEPSTLALLAVPLAWFCLLRRKR